MINSLQSNNLLFRDGTSQQDRQIDALRPDYIQVEDRSMEQLIGEAQRLAKELRFFDANNQTKPAQTWESFLVEDPVIYKNEQEGGTKRKVLREQWASQLAAYVEDPESFANDQEKVRKLSRPHVVLFMTFLKLLRHLKTQINGLTERHLDFYFRERLGLTSKDAVPDVVHVLLELSEDTEQVELKKGTILLGGIDSSGNELHYKTNEDTVISQAKIEQLKNVFVDKQKLTIKSTHIKNRDIPDLALANMLRMAVGHPNVGDPLPDFPDAIESVFELSDEVQKGNEIAMNYVTAHLFLTIESFAFIFEKNEEEKEGAVTDWQEIYEILDFAHKNKIKDKRQQALKELNNTEDFDTVLKQVYGSPLPNDELPLYRGARASFDIVFEDLKIEGTVAEEALAYIEEDLKLKEQDFVHIVQTSKDQNAEEKDVVKMYRILELADRQVRRIVLPSPVIEKISDIYAAADARANSFSQYEDEEESKRFATFGNGGFNGISSLEPANIGFAISSPTLVLREGNRTLYGVIEVDAGAETKELVAAIDKASKNGLPPLSVSLSSKDGWFQPAHVTLLKAAMYSNGEVEKKCVLDSFINSKILTISSEVPFDNLDQGKYLKINTTSYYEIIKVQSPREAEVKLLSGEPSGESGDEIFMYSREQVFIHNLSISIEIDENEPPVVPFDPTLPEVPIRSAYPCLLISMNRPQVDTPEQDALVVGYQQLSKLKFLNINMLVLVKDMRNVIFQNEQGVMDVKKSFEPFGTTTPEVGESFYLANEEICNKRLENINIKLDWVKLPEDIREHYKNYWHILADDPNLSSSQYPILFESDIKAKLFFNDKRVEIPIAPIELLKSSGASVHPMPDKIKEAAPDYTYDLAPNARVGLDDVTDWDRYFRVVLDPLDFQHSVYNTLFTKQALSTKQAIKELQIHPPYQPKVNGARVGYLTYLTMYPGVVPTNDYDTMYHVTPFGYKELDTAKQLNLLPTYQDEGTLYLGVAKLHVPGVLTILFQMAEGSADPDAQKPELQWSYIRHNEWVDLSTSAILVDGTNGLVNTGIVTIKIPTEATAGGTLMPAALYWLRVRAASNIAGVSDTIDIQSQVISATLSNTSVDPSHFETPLAAETITEFQVPIPEITTISQPFTSTKGKPVEQGIDLYKRLSERLRHKNRAITSWDYEHMVLDKFPQIYKVKCLPSEDVLGKVALVVVPDIRKRIPFNPFAPKVAADTLFQIHEYLENYAPAHAEVAVSNPFYLQVLTRCVVQFNSGYDTGFYKEKLVEEIKHFLSPWAYGQNHDIRMGNTLHASVLINFIAERPYIDYVANLKLFQSEDGVTFTDVRSINDGKSMVVPFRPDMVMVSAPSHFITVFDENGYDEDDFEGINYMKVELDFTVI